MRTKLQWFGMNDFMREKKIFTLDFDYYFDGM